MHLPRAGADILDGHHDDVRAARRQVANHVTTTDDTIPVRPYKATAPGTHPAELQRLALQERSHPDCEPLTVQTVIWLYRSYSAAVSAQSEGLRPLDLSPSAFNVLMALHNSPGHTLEPRELSERLLVTRPSVTGLLHTLQRKGLVTRRPHGQDGRRLRVLLTPAGLELLERYFPTHYAQQRELFGDLAPDELATLVTLLRRVRGAQPRYPDGPSPTAGG